MVSFVPEPIFFLGPLPVTNTLLATFLVDILIVVGLYFLYKNINHKPGFFQNLIEMVIETILDLNKSISQKNYLKIFPWMMTFFVVILLANWTSLLPGFSTIGFYHGKDLVPLLRSPSSDLNFTLALALVSLFATHSLSVSTLGTKEYFMRYFSWNPIYLFVGLLEIVSEITKVVSLSFRLFGNIFAGEVVLATISSKFTAFILPLPFYALEMIVGLVQALVFSMLTMSFMAIMTTPHHEETEGEHH